MGFPEAARRLGVPIGVLRRAIRAGRISAPARLTATATLSADWLEGAKAEAETAPKALRRNSPQTTPPFARYEGTSAWRKYRHRVREHARFAAIDGSVGR